MTKTFEAIFDGRVLRPIEPLDLDPNTRVLVTIDSSETPIIASQSFLETARSLQIDGPADWSSSIDDYLYGKSATDKT